eukprot:CAMPEP_0175766430 /NCGR_PEP_ID=MMETSP0097-20121207/69367_1 /TAXON_ID=311494 /ORGANISM="Alexandrium monilatum, Strain CCMP3105" /LENGTH=120 /DNA_ID=CAMNT_0017076427 /DNA_START=97 /DNA_END=456 /DNA_ORIENTATION=-
MCVYNEPGQGRIPDLVHFLGAGAYMLDHVAAMRIMNTKREYVLTFSASFGLMCLALWWKKQIRRRSGMGLESETPQEKLQEQLAAMVPGWRKRLWWSELLFMVFENCLFTAFVLGMRSGL